MCGFQSKHGEMNIDLRSLCLLMPWPMAWVEGQVEPFDLLLVRPRSSHGPMPPPLRHDFPAPMKLDCTRPKQFRRNQDGKIEFGSENCKDCKRVNLIAQQEPCLCQLLAYVSKNIKKKTDISDISKKYSRLGGFVPSKAIPSWKHHCVGSKPLSYCMFQHEIHQQRDSRDHSSPV